MGLEDVLDAYAHIARQFEVDVYVKARIDDRGNPGAIVPDDIRRSPDHHG
jgi:hypothetical protein